MSYHVQFPGLGWAFDVHTTAFKIGGFSVAWYGVIIACGFLLAIAYALASCKRMNIDSNRLLDAVICGAVAGIVGARLYYVLFYPGDLYRNDPIQILNITAGGLGIYGGIIAGLGVGALVARLRKLSVPAVLDVAVLGYLIGQCIGRWGNFINQEAFGAQTDLPWGMMSEATGGVTVHPCFLYESLWCLLGFVLLHLFTRKLRRYDGQTFLLYLLWYGVGRFFIESLRTDSLYIDLFIAQVKVSQLVAVATVAIAVILLIALRRRTVLTGCGNARVMELNAVNRQVVEEEIPKEVVYSSILGVKGESKAPQKREAADKPDGAADSAEKK